MKVSVLVDGLRFLAAGLLLIAVAGCAGEGGEPSDSGSDGGLDSGADGSLDAGPVWPSCGLVRGGAVLESKAARFDRIARELHLAGDGLLRNAYLSEGLDAPEYWMHVENVILWSGIYLASQAFRYAVVGDAEAQENARTVVKALGELTQVTGSRGLYGRSMIKPGIAYNNVDPANPGWTDSPVKGLEGWRFRNDVSKDGYDGLMFGYAAALEHFDDPALLDEIRGRLREIMDHIVGNGLKIVDWNGAVTEHGRLYQSAMDDYPGFNAMLASSWVKIGAVELGDSSLDDFYYGCLMRKRKDVACPQIDTMDMGSYIQSMEEMLYLFLPGYMQNYDNFDMCYQAMYPLLRREQDRTLRSRLTGVLRKSMFHTDDPSYQSVALIGNSFFTFAYAALTGDAPGADPVLDDAVCRAIVTLKDFPEEKYRRYIPAGNQTAVGTNRLGKKVAASPIPLAEYDFDNYLWRLDFFEIQPGTPLDRRMLWSPEDYLMAYWMGRLHGLLPPGL